jgi:aldose 1-epimerase
MERIDVEGLEGVRLRSGPSGLAATFVPGAGMVGASLRDGDAELLWQGDGVRRYASGLTTMGIPLLHPWANRLDGWRYAVDGTVVELDRGAPRLARDEHGLPIHGLLGGAPWWHVLDPPAPGALAAELDFAARPELLAAFPFPHRLRLDVALVERTLTVRTTLTPTGAEPVPVSFGFHPYLRLPDVARERWHVELPAMERLELDARAIPTGAADPFAAQAGPLGARTFDDGFRGLEPGVRFVLAGGGRRVTVRFDEGYPFAQVFAPAAHDVICFEPMTAPTNALVSGDGLVRAAPGAPYVATFSINVEHRA